MVLNVHRACGLGMILKLFSTLDLSLLAQAKYIGKRNIKKDIRYLVRHDRNALNLNLISKPRSLASNSVSSGSTLFAKQRG